MKKYLIDGIEIISSYKRRTGFGEIVGCCAFLIAVGAILLGYLSLIANCN